MDIGEKNQAYLTDLIKLQRTVEPWQCVSVVKLNLRLY